MDEVNVEVEIARLDKGNQAATQHISYHGLCIEGATDVVLDIGKLNALATDLDLCIAAANVDERAVKITAHQVAGLV